MNKMTKIAVSTIIAAAVLAGGVRYLWSIRLTAEMERETSKTVRREFRKAPLDEAAMRLDKLVAEKSFTVRFGKAFPYISMGMEPKVKYDFIGLLAEEAFIRLAGDVKSPKADTDRRIKDLIAFSARMLESGTLSKSAANSLRERRLDGFFLVNDFDGAIAMLDKGLDGRTPEWCKSTAAKLRAHKAMESGDRKEAVKQLIVFIDYMLSDEMKDFEDSDPANGVVYSREWVAAKNCMRCATLSGEAGDAKAKADFTEKAKPLYKTALEKAKDDDISIKELQKEMKSYGL
jgi:hypothetical protein